MLRHVDPGGRLYTAVGTSNANVAAHWTAVVINASTLSIQSSGGRVSGSCLRFAIINGANNIYVSKVLDNQSVWGITFALKASMYPVGGTLPIIAIDDSSTGQVSLVINSTGTLSINNGTDVAPVTLGTTPFAIMLNTWNHFELKVTIHPTAGTVELRINSVVQIGPLTLQNTRRSSNSTANTIRIGNPFQGSAASYSGNLDYDDIIIWDGQTNDANGLADISDFVGDCGLSVLRPSGVGNTTQFTPDAGSNYARVNETTPDTSSYVESSTVSQKDTYVMDDLAGTITAVKSLATLIYAEKTAAGSRQIGSVIRSGGTDYIHPTGIDLSNSYLYYSRNWGKNPNTSTTWTTSDINAIESGQVVNT